MCDSLLALLVSEANDRTIVDPDGNVDGDSFLYATLDFFSTWAESDSVDTAEFGRRSRIAWDRLLALPNPAFELGLPTLPTSPTDPMSSRPVPKPQDVSEATWDELMEHLDGLVGLKDVKRQVRADVAGKRVDAERVRRLLPIVSPSLHMVFSGNPGTGKTTVARILAGLYFQAGILTKGHLLEVGPGDLLGRWQGENRQRAQEIIERALGGVLLVDEAYTLAGTDRGPTEFQQEVIDVLVKGMEDHRHDLVVILTGYAAPMDRLLAANPGLESRIGERIEFPDYSTPELLEILDGLCGEYQMVLPEESTSELGTMLDALPRNERFGNARLIRNVFEDLVANLNLRISDAPLSEMATSVLNGITIEDVLSVRDDIVTGRASVKRHPLGFVP